jgi:hypothetical protein
LMTTVWLPLCVIIAVMCNYRSHYRGVVTHCVGGVAQWVCGATGN